jgi:hypothetical protein
MTDITIAARMARYERAQARKGFVRVTVWVPAIGGRDALRAYARQLRTAEAPPRKSRRSSSN